MGFLWIRGNNNSPFSRNQPRIWEPERCYRLLHCDLKLLEYSPNIFYPSQWSFQVNRLRWVQFPGFGEDCWCWICFWLSTSWSLIFCWRIWWDLPYKSKVGDGWVLRGVCKCFGDLRLISFRNLPNTDLWWLTIFMNCLSKSIEMFWLFFGFWVCSRELPMSIIRSSSFTSTSWTLSKSTEIALDCSCLSMETLLLRRLGGLEMIFFKVCSLRGFFWRNLDVQIKVHVSVLVTVSKSNADIEINASPEIFRVDLNCLHAFDMLLMELLSWVIFSWEHRWSTPTKRVMLRFLELTWRR